MNTSPIPVTIYTLRHNVLLVDLAVADAEHERSSPEINLDSTDLTISQKTVLFGILTQFFDLFMPRGGPVGQTTVVKHAILTEDPSVRQLMFRVPEALKNVVNSEVTKMLKQET